jgi:hypothetical protein
MSGPPSVRIREATAYAEGVVSSLELTLVVTAAAGSAAVLLRASRGAPRARWLALAAMGTVAAASAAKRAPSEPTPVDPARPREAFGGEYVSSNACRSCHPAEYESWHHTYHRTMTQDATPSALAAPLDGRTLTLDGQSYRLERRGDEVWATLPDPDAVAEAALRGSVANALADVERRVVLTTGSHHEQAYWVKGRRPGELRLFPFVFMIAEARWVPRRDAFLAPPDAPPHALRWNSNCIVCHTVGGRPGHDLGRDDFNTRVVELGIACEACHGPGGAHVRRHRDPITRYAAQQREAEDRTIVNPARLAPERAAAICGQCHSYTYPRDEDEWWSHGYALSYRPGQTLDASRTLLSLARLEDESGPGVEAARESLFWADGAIRVGGREYNALVESPCFTRGRGGRTMTCLSCHSMHAGDPDSQLAPTRKGDLACLSCHDGENSSAHTHHAAGSSGSSCLDCHMPRTSYALFRPIRSHRIDSPSVATAQRGGHPNACNLCHLDKSLAWTQGFLERWYGAPHVEIAGERAHLSASVVDAMCGDAALRVVTAGALGWKPALAASGDGWEAPLLAELLVDPYAAVRFVAGRSLHALSGYEAIPYDFLAPPEERARARAVVLDRFAQRGPGPSSREARTAMGLTAEGASDTRLRNALLAERDTRAITIAE